MKNEENTLAQGRRSWGLGVLTPWKYVGRVRVCFDPLKMSHSFIQNCCITASFTASRMNGWTLSLHWSCLCWRCYHLYVWSAPSRQCPPINVFAAPLSLKLSWPKTKLQNMGAGDPSSTILIHHGSYAVLPTIDRLQLGWLTRGVYSEGWEVLTHYNMLEGSEYVLTPLKCHFLSFKTTVV